MALWKKNYGQQLYRTRLRSLSEFHNESPYIVEFTVTRHLWVNNTYFVIGWNRRLHSINETLYFISINHNESIHIIALGIIFSVAGVIRFSCHLQDLLRLFRIFFTVEKKCGHESYPCLDPSIFLSQGWTAFIIVSKKIYSSF